MDYKKIYDKIIENRKKNPLTGGEYDETHHIIPRSLGGSDDTENLVKLTAREHFIVHALLAEMYENESFEWYKMNHAFIMMKVSNDNQCRYINNRLYEYKRLDFSKVMKKSQSGKKNSQYGKVWVHSKVEQSNKKINYSEIELYKSNGWEEGRIMDFDKYILKSNKPKLNTFMGIKYNKSRIDSIKKIFQINLNENFEVGIVKLKKILYQQYVVENLSTTQIAKLYNSTDPTIRKYLIELGIGTKNKGGNWATKKS
jgi:hypothetical protein